MKSFFDSNIKNNKVAIIPCSQKKLTTPAPAYLLYSASPIFSTLYNYAILNFEHILILSALHGLIEPYKIIEPYDYKLPQNIPTHFKNEIQNILKKYSVNNITSFCSAHYNSILPDNINTFEMSFYDKTKMFGTGKSIKGNVFPIKKILEFIYHNGPITKNKLFDFIQNNWTNKNTQQLQFERTLKSDFILVHNNKVYYKFKIKSLK